ncbi:MAG: MarC family NAAT transporter [Bacteroidetes bacterium]|nr:MarC family NAAT transporter [Bacteroidota bacterium]
MWELFIGSLAALFSVVNPLGAVPVFLAMTPHYTKIERNKTARATSLYFMMILLVFFFAGVGILGFFGISLNAMRIAGGFVILSSGYSLLAGKMAEGRAINNKVREEALEKEDISFSPMAMPMLSGPGSISLLITFYSENPDWGNRFVIAGSVIGMALIIFLILRSAPYLFKLLGVAGLKALSRIMGFIVMAIGIQYIIYGVVHLVESLR